jgi:hypothetical protein
MSLATILVELKSERDRLHRAIRALEGTAPRRGRPKNAQIPTVRRRRRVSAEARRRISVAMRKSWAERKRKAGLTGEPMARSDRQHASVPEEALRSLRLRPSRIARSSA